jgi:hypothetical protein
MIPSAYGNRSPAGITSPTFARKRAPLAAGKLHIRLLQRMNRLAAQK